MILKSVKKKKGYYIQGNYTNHGWSLIRNHGCQKTVEKDFDASSPHSPPPKPHSIQSSIRKKTFFNNKGKIKAFQIKKCEEILCQQIGTIRCAKENSSEVTLNGKSDLQEGLKRTRNGNMWVNMKDKFFSSLKFLKDYGLFNAKIIIFIVKLGHIWK